jgi:hypothetical protein
MREREEEEQKYGNMFFFFLLLTRKSLLWGKSKEGFVRHDPYVLFSSYASTTFCMGCEKWKHGKTDHDWPSLNMVVTKDSQQYILCCESCVYL